MGAYHADSGILSKGNSAMTKGIAAGLLAVAMVLACLTGCVPARRVPPPASPAAATLDTPSVTLYVRTGCPFCREARAFFASRGIPVRERNIGEDREALVEMLDIHMRSFPEDEPIVPLIVIGDRVFSGFDQHEVEAALDEMKQRPVSGSKP